MGVFLGQSSFGGLAEWFALKAHPPRAGKAGRRLKDHSGGSGEFTVKGRSWKLLFYQAFVNEQDARQEEKFLKTGKGRERLNFLLKNVLEDWLSG